MAKIMAYGLAVMLGLFSGNLFAEGNAYQIELIVFSQNGPNTEVFDQTESRIKWPVALTELSAYKQIDNMVLNDSLAALSKDPGYRLMLHISWMQSAGDGNVFAPVHIQTADGKLNGYLQIQQEQSLQMTVDLEYMSNQNDSSGKTIIYRLNEKRPVKLNEVYYLDHPKLGVIAQINTL